MVSVQCATSTCTSGMAMYGLLQRFLKGGIFVGQTSISFVLSRVFHRLATSKVLGRSHRTSLGRRSYLLLDCLEKEMNGLHQAQLGHVLCEQSPVGL